MLMANGTNKHAVLAFSTQQAVSLLTYLLELVTSQWLVVTPEEFRINILQPIIILKEIKSPNICILFSATLKDSL